jgi:hypothetical protein
VWLKGLFTTCCDTSREISLQYVVPPAGNPIHRWQANPCLFGT